MPASGAGKIFARAKEAAAAKPTEIYYLSTCKTLVRAVKLTVIFLLAGLLQVSARTTAQTRISINLRGATLEKVFTEIEKRSGYTVFYNTEVLKVAGGSLVSVELKDATIEDVMHQCLKGLPLEFYVQEKTIFVKKEARRAVAEPAPGPGSPIPSTLSGIVRTETGTPLVGATVYVLKLRKTVATNKDGEFTLRDVPDGEYEVIISYIGYENYRTKVSVTNHEAWLSADMKASMSKLDETVVKGYYNTTNRLNTGDVTTVKGETIQEQPVSDPVMALEGRVPGLYISQTSGLPGASYSVLLQGRNSIANGINPLYIIDGVPMTATSLTSFTIAGGAVGTPNQFPGVSQGAGVSPFNSLNPADIESIEVLKDADATAIYGSRGANGVILITTKRGKSGQSKVDVNVFDGEGKVTRMYNLMNTQQYLAMRHEAFYNDSMANPAAKIKPGNTDYDINGVWDSTRYTNWQKVLIGGKAHYTNAQASVSGGNANTQFVFGGGYSRQTTVFPGDYSDTKISGYTNINHASNNQRFHALFSAQYLIDNNNLPATDFTSLSYQAPDAPPIYLSNGQFGWGGGTWANPLVGTVKHDLAITNNLMSSLNLAYELIPGLQIKSNFGYTRMEMNQSNQTPATAFYGAPVQNNRSNFIANSSVSTWIIEPQLNYGRRISQGKLDVLIGSTIQENKQATYGEKFYGFLNDVLISDPGSASNVTIYGSYSTDYKYNALYGRISYNWQDKYILNATARRDGSSRFGAGSQFGNFGALGAAWIFTKEHFFVDHVTFLSFGKLRGSYGTTGNDQITDYEYLSTYSSEPAYQGVAGLYPTRIANPYFRWEIVRKLEGGVDLGLLKDRIMLGVTYFRNRTGNQLVGDNLPSIDGFTTIQANLPAIVQNTGVEIDLNTTNIRSKSFNWSTSINMTIPRNKLVSYPGLATSTNNNNYAIGKSLFIKKYYHYMYVDPQLGTYTFQDLDHNGMINGSDKEFTKQITQNYYGGLLNTFSYKGIQLDIFFQFVKQTGLNYYSGSSLAGGANINVPKFVSDRWHSAGQLTQDEQFSAGKNSVVTASWQNMLSSDKIISDASFARLKNLALSYTLPATWQRKATLKNVRVYLQIQNLFTITQYKGLDPETQNNNVLPPLRMITAGIQLSL